MATHTCDEGFELFEVSGSVPSSNVRTCSVENGWSGSDLECVCKLQAKGVECRMQNMAVIVQCLYVVERVYNSHTWVYAK